MKAERSPGFGGSAVALGASNLVIVALAAQLNWRAQEILWLYWIQSIVIGAFSLIRVIGLIRWNARQATPTPPGEYVQSLPGFVIFFVFFHLFFLMVLAALQAFTTDAGMAACIAMFLVQSALDDRRDRSLDAAEGTPDPMRIIYLALGRILPFFLMLALIATVRSKQAVVYALLVKMVADSVMHPAGAGNTRSKPASPDFSILGVDVYLPFNRTVGLTIVAALLTAAYFFYFEPRGKT